MPIAERDKGGKGRLKRALPGVGVTVAGSLIWAVLAAISAAVALVWMRGFMNTGQITSLALMFAVGAAIAFPLALYVTNLVAPKRSIGRVLFMALALAIFTIVATSAVFALIYRDYYSQWHGPAFSRLWLWQQFFTVGGAVFQYLVVGLRLYVPVGLVGLIGLSLWANRLAH